jgi:hypothetical protein
MEAYVRLRKRLAEFPLELKFFQTQQVEKKSEHKFHVFRKSCRLWDYVQKYGGVEQATDGNIIGRMRVACWMTKTYTPNM